MRRAKDRRTSGLKWSQFSIILRRKTATRHHSETRKEQNIRGLIILAISLSLLILTNGEYISPKVLLGDVINFFNFSHDSDGQNSIYIYVYKGRYSNGIICNKEFLTPGSKTSSAHVILHLLVFCFWATGRISSSIIIRVYILCI